ncbi:IS3 family transposase [Streptomyces mirabilis]|uniref:IS3 family transposase n=1 Tax=Streptomyces mirabilis TaxID=68239 RepID=A0ABU3V5R0_9ACTN|nr:IS3 family transposase [Streptomyces mirabilis]MCX5355866.1 IS3 family transposase [Streptomyces mirabilis]MDU9001508.1 IS3 family transposase [Streptomyces mirabilis]
MVLQAPYTPAHLRELRRQHLVEAVKEEFDDSGGTYGSSTIWIRLVGQGWRVSVNAIAEIMSEFGWSRGRYADGGGWPGRGNGRPPRTSCGGTSPVPRR